MRIITYSGLLAEDDIDRDDCNDKSSVIQCNNKRHLQYMVDWIKSKLTSSSLAILCGGQSSDHRCGEYTNPRSTDLNDGRDELFKEVLM